MNAVSASSVSASRTRRDLRLGIGTRLTMSLGAIILLMLFGSSVAFWQFLLVERQARHLYEADQLAMAVLHLHGDLFTLRDRLQVLLNTRQAHSFIEGVTPLRREFQHDIERTQAVLIDQNGGARRHRLEIGILSSVQSSLPNQMDAMVQLVRVGDWDAAQRRLDNQVRTISEATGTLVQGIGAEVNRDERFDLDRIHRVEQDAIRTLCLAGLLTLLTGALLGWLVTRSITKPLADLDAGAQALADGDFSVRVQDRGNDELARLAGVFNSMAERLQSLYGALQRSESQFRSLIEHGSDLILLLDRHAVVRYASPSFRTRLGLDPAALVGDEAFRYVHPDDIEPARQVFRTQLSESGVSPTMEIRIRHASGRWHTVEIVLNDLLRDPDVQGVIVNGRDVTARRVLEDQLRQSQKMEAVGRLAAGIAHDFNNLLTVIRGHCELQLIEPRQDGTVHSSFAEIREAADRAAALTHQLLTFSRQQVTRPRALDLNQCIAEFESMLHRLIGEDVSLAFRPAPRLGEIRADSGMIQQVVMNLVVNARDAMPNGGSVLIETTEADVGASARPGSNQVPPGRYIVLAVTDSGVGMDAATQNRIFEPFFTTKEVGKGTGLGLATVYGIIRQSEGYIAVTSEPGKGSTFRVYFPRIDEPGDATLPMPARVRHQGRETILLVQEEESLRIMIEEYLTELGYRVLVSSSPRETMLQSRFKPEKPDLLIIDLEGTDSAPTEMAEALRQQLPALKILYTSVDTSQEIHWHAPALSGVALVRKPFGLLMFSRKVRDLLDGRYGA